MGSAVTLQEFAFKLSVTATCDVPAVLFRFQYSQMLKFDILLSVVFPRVWAVLKYCAVKASVAFAEALIVIG